MAKKDIAQHLREQTKRTDLPDDVIRTMAEAYAEIVRLEKRILDFQEGFEGGCYLCEPVGEMNRKLREEIGHASILLADWDGYYNPNTRIGNDIELAKLIEDAYRVLQNGKSWRDKNG